MLIRCEKCSTVYELDEKLLPPQGAPVQCSKCQFVFKAYPRQDPSPPAAAGQDPSEAAVDPAEPLEHELSDTVVPPVTASERPPPFRDTSADLVREAGSLAGSAPDRLASVGQAGARAPPPAPAPPSRPSTSPGAPGGGEQRFTADGRPIRKVPFPTSEPAQPVSRPPLPVRSASRRATGPMRWVIPAAVIVLALAAVLTWWLLGHGHGRSAQPQAEQPPRQSRVEAQAGSRAATLPTTATGETAHRPAADAHASQAAPTLDAGGTRPEPSATAGSPARKSFTQR